MVNSPIIINNNHCSSVVDDTLVDLCFHGNDKALKKVDLNIFTLWSWIRFYVYDVIVDGSSTWKSSFLAWHSSSISSSSCLLDISNWTGGIFQAWSSSTSSCLLTCWIKDPSALNIKIEDLLKLQYKNKESSSCWHGIWTKAIYCWRDI